MLFWQPLNIEGLDRAAHDRILERLDLELRSWDGTPFLDGQMVKRVGVDCLRFAGAILDSLYRTRRAHLLPRLRRDQPLNAPLESQAAIDEIKRIYPNHVKLPDLYLQPGDIATTGPEACEAHVVIAGVESGQFWHAHNDSVKWTGQRVLNRHYDRVHGAYRMTDRVLWA